MFANLWSSASLAISKAVRRVSATRRARLKVLDVFGVLLRHVLDGKEHPRAEHQHGHHSDDVAE